MQLCSQIFAIQEERKKIKISFVFFILTIIFATEGKHCMHLNSAILFSDKGEKLNGVVVVMEFTSYSSSTIGRTVFCHVFSLEEGVVEEVILHFYNS